VLKTHGKTREEIERTRTNFELKLDDVREDA